MENKQIDQIIRRTQRAWYVDGIWEIGFGLALFVISLYYWLVVWFDWESRFGMWLPVIQIGIFLGAFLPVRWVVGWLKQHITFPRTGYVVFRQKARSGIWRRIVVGAGMGILVSGLVVALSFAANMKAIVPVVIGLVLSGSMLYLSFRFSILRFAISAVLTFALGITVGFFQPDDTTGAALLLSGFGALNLVAGGLTLWSFVRGNPIPRDDTGLEDV